MDAYWRIEGADGRRDIAGRRPGSSCNRGLAVGPMSSEDRAPGKGSDSALTAGERDRHALTRLYEHPPAFVTGPVAARPTTLRGRRPESPGASALPPLPRLSRALRAISFGSANAAGRTGARPPLIDYSVATPTRDANLTPTSVVAVSDERKFPRSFLRDAQRQMACDIPPRDIAAALRDPSALLWVDIDSSNRHQHAILEKLFKFHPLTVEDTLSPNSRVKIEAYDGYLFIVMRAVRFCDTTDDPYDLETENLYIYLGPNYVVTVHAAASQSVSAVADLVLRSPDLLNRPAARLVHLIADAAIDEYFPIVDQIDAFVEGLEARVFEKFDDTALHDIFALKRMVLSLRRYLSPQREIFNVLANRPSPLLPADAQLYFRDVHDHVIRINETLDTYRELLASTLDSYLTQVSNRLGTITKGLSVVATISVPFVVISGMWGMNFQEIPLASSGHGFWLMLVLQLALGLGLAMLLRRKRLL